MDHLEKGINRHIFIPLLFLIFASATSIKAQTYKFEQYGIEEGICHTTVYTLNQDVNGYMWIGTGEGLCRFDGFNFNNATTFDTITKSPVETSFLDSNGNLWFGHADGNIEVYNGRSFNFIDSEGLISSKIANISEDSDNNVWIATQSNGIFIFDKNLQFKQISKGLEGIWLSTFQLSPDNNTLIVGTLEGLAIFEVHASTEEVKQTISVKELEYLNIQSIYVYKENTYLIGTEDAGLFKLTCDNNNYTLERTEVFGDKSLNIQWIGSDNDGNLWIATFGNGVYKLNADLSQTTEMQNFTPANGLFSTDIKCVFQDFEGNIWLGTYDLGLARMLDESLVFYDFSKYNFDNDISAITIKDNNTWYGSKGSILKKEEGVETKYKLYNQKDGLPNEKITALYADSNSDVWIGTSGKGLYKLNGKSGSISNLYFSENSLENMINAITGNDEFVWVATNSGVVVYDLKNNTKEILTTTEGLPHNNIRDVFLSSDGTAWIATKSNGLYSLNKDQHLKIESKAELEFTCIAEDDKGNLWAGTYGDGIFKFSKDSLVHISADNGLLSNYCYSLIGDQGYIWVGHRLGLSRINAAKIGVRSYGIEAGMTGDCNNNSVAKDGNGRLLFGTTKNIVDFDIKKERKNPNPPKINISQVKLNDKEYTAYDDIVLKYGLYKLRVDFIGINFTSPKDVIYQYMLDGYDLEWSDFSTTRFVQYPRIEDGEYKFLIRACNEDGLCNSDPKELVIKVKKPFWKTWIFIISLVVIALVTFYLIIRIRERKQLKFQQYLQEKLDERTKEVVEQKEEIESINRDITDSINYAQRIQASILPPIKKLQDNFSGSFVFYLPRDIVSGDFYWFDMTNQYTFIIVCADSTGHGVPGAFMSMIGTTLIKDICQRKGVNSPTQILNVLDQEIQSTLNQSLDAGKSSDGMDIIVCEINIKTLRMRYASAMRPLLVYKDGDITYYKGSQNSIGGEGENIKKVFEEEEIQLSKGDIIYMFSDGYTDQFGGPHGKKFKMVRLKNLLKDIYEKPMEEQYKFVKSSFELWKDQFPQVDDVLFMGIKI